MQKDGAIARLQESDMTKTLTIPRRVPGQRLLASAVLGALLATSPLAGAAPTLAGVEGIAGLLRMNASCVVSVSFQSACTFISPMSVLIRSAAASAVAAASFATRAASISGG